ncbi:MAG: hypothetical protein QM621_12265 [Aeromicrobium sp.]|uniref:DUF7927 domain-containing protein n=1 Tax=Aeromicrobium sp. TaxID=1871063 RepID=UPI0039E2EF4F
MSRRPLSQRPAIAATLLSLLAVLLWPVSPATAVTNPDGSRSIGGSTYYAYVGPGETLDFAWQRTGNSAPTGSIDIRVTAPDGTTAQTCSVVTSDALNTVTCSGTDLTGEGVWTLEEIPREGSGYVPDTFLKPAVNGYFRWDIEVHDASDAEISGRVWTDAYIAYDSTTADGSRDFDFWAVTEFGAVWQMGLRTFVGNGWNIDASAFGIVGSGTCKPSYSSTDTLGSNTARYQQADPELCGDPYWLFFEQPASDLPASATAGVPGSDGSTTTMSVLPDYAPPAVTDIAYDSTTGASRAGEFSWTLERFTGTYELRLDTDGNGSFDDDVDVAADVSGSSGTATYNWNGIDGEGNAVDFCQDIGAEVRIQHTDEFHVVLADVEGLAGGMIVNQLVGSEPGENKLYWDDSKLTGTRNTTVTPSLSSLAGTDSSNGTSRWNNGGTSNGGPWGNGRALDRWSYSDVEIAEQASFAPDCSVRVEKSSSADDNDGSAEVGDVVEYEVTVENTGDVDFTEDNPAQVVDDLSGVLDVAAYNDDAVADPAVGTVSYSEPRLTWSGPLAAGESVVLTYSVTVTANGGDGAGTNIVFAVPEGDDPDDYETPSCDDGEFDTDVGLFCGVSSFRVPSLRVEKSADRLTLPADGESVTYTVTGTNMGPGAYTASSPAVVVDDLSGVLDDAVLDEGSLSASTGDTPTVDGDRIVWSGPLAAGEVVVITYTLTYDEGAGDASLVNVAFGPSDADDPTPACDPRTDDGFDEATGVPCDVNTLPGSDLSVQKTADAPSGTGVAAGDVLTYTLTFANNGQADAAVDYTDTTTGLSDDATVSSAEASDESLTVTDTGDGFQITGAVAPGTVVTVTYTATVLPFDEQGDHVLANFLLPTGEEPPTGVGLDACVPGSEDCTVHFMPRLVVSKSTDPASGVSVQSGDVLSYTLSFENAGTGVAQVDHVDDLSGVLDDASLTDGPSTASEVLYPVLEGSVLGVTGSVPAGTTETVAYAVTVNPDGFHGDNVLANFLVAAGEEPPAECVEGDTSCTGHLVGELSVVKAADPESGTEVLPGDVVSYMLAFENVGTGPYEVDRVDDLSGVLDDADLTSGPSSAEGLLAAGPLSGSRLPVTGVLEAGEGDVVSYAATVRARADLGDGVLGNWVLGPEEEVPSGGCVMAPYVACTVHTVAEEAESPVAALLPRTGAGASAGLLLLAVVTVGVGGLLVRRQRRHG